MDPLKIMIVEDSKVSQELLKGILSRDPSLSITGIFSSAEEALSNLSLKPDVITIDINLPKMDGYALTKQIMKQQPIPIVIISARLSSQQVEKSFQALEAGALSVLEKPLGPNDPLFNAKAEEIISHIRSAAYAGRSPAFLNMAGLQESFKRHTAPIQGVVIGGSLGGPQALKTILSTLPPQFPAPIYVVQHISPGFTSGLARWLQGETFLNVKVASEGEKGLAGTVYIAPDLLHLTITKKGTVALIKEPNNKAIHPSVGKLFQSAADNLGEKSIGVMLSGMGKDGAQELLRMKEKGAYTIAQDENSCVMFGMPSEAIRLKGVTKVLPLHQIGGHLLQLTLRTGVAIWTEPKPRDRIVKKGNIFT